MVTHTTDFYTKNPSLVRQSLKTEIDELPESVLFTVFEFLSFEKQRFQTGIHRNEAQENSKKKAALECLKKYSGTVHFEKSWKEELYEALDEKYNYPR
jgi:hypothetical protein